MSIDGSESSNPVEKDGSGSSYEEITFNPNAENPFRCQSRARQHPFTTNNARANQVRPLRVARGRVVNSRIRGRAFCGKRRLSRCFDNALHGQRHSPANSVAQQQCQTVIGSSLSSTEIDTVLPIAQSKTAATLSVSETAPTSIKLVPTTLTATLHSPSPASRNAPVVLEDTDDEPYVTVQYEESQDWENDSEDN